MRYRFRTRLHPAFFGMFAAALLYDGLVAIHLQDVLRGIWTELGKRPLGSEAARFYLLLVVAAGAGLLGGALDSRAKLVGSSAASSQDILLRTVKAVVVIVPFGLGLDILYQSIGAGWSRPAEVAVIVVLFGLLPYFLLRWVTGCFFRMFYMKR